MDPDEIAALCERLKLEAEDTPTLSVTTDDSNEGYWNISTCLVGKIIGGRTVNREGLESALRIIWKTRFSFQIEAKPGQNIFLFRFTTEEDRNTVYNGGPWLFNKQVISLIKPSGVGDISSMNFLRIPFWIHILNLPLICLTERCIMNIGGLLGEVLATDLEGIVPRVKVIINAGRPLQRGLKVFLEAMGEEFTLPIQYERLPDFCFGCGMIGHRLCECQTQQPALKNPCKFGDWLRAVPIRAKKKMRSNPSEEDNSADPTIYKNDHNADEADNYDPKDSQTHGNSVNKLEMGQEVTSPHMMEMGTKQGDLLTDKTSSQAGIPNNTFLSDLTLLDATVNEGKTNTGTSNQGNKGRDWRRMKSPKKNLILGTTKNLLMLSPSKMKGKGVMSSKSINSSSKRRILENSDEDSRSPKKVRSASLGNNTSNLISTATPAMRGCRSP
ncbi:hypothetical protein DH2020_024125 [Rehmannia glutinosa]|uniref:CCHC-type domain-containing protein n=1 Tax=Rehmannia glutinosa TaxID=99300 RepID=A0ABR0W7X9_REHGL